jgi:Zn-dependent membrane protease YugP
MAIMTFPVEKAHATCKAYLQLAQDAIIACDFYAAAREVLNADRVAVIAHDMTQCELFRRDLVELYGVDWKKAVEAYKK